MEINKIIIIRILFIVALLTVNLYSQQGWFPLNIVANSNSFNSIFFINDSVGYTVSNEGLVLISEDYGNTWNPLTLTTSSLNDVFFINEVGFIVGDKGRIFKTVDGIIWDEKISHTNEKLNSIYFIDADTGYIFGNASTILKTINGGESWSDLNAPLNLTITDGAFPVADFGMCVTAEGYILRTFNYGLTWEYRLYADYDAFYSIVFTNDTTAYISGWESDLGFLMKTMDRGFNFQHIYPNVFFNITSIFFVNENLAFIVGDGGYIGKTTDSGVTWRTIYNQSYKKLYSIFFTDSLNGYAVGEDSTILKTTDGGEIWLLLGSGFTSQLMAVDFPTSEIGFAAGTNGEVYKITDNKATLIYRETSFYNGFYFVYFINEFIGFTGGSNGKFFRTSDGGQSWILEDFRPQNVISMWTVDFYDDQIGIISADDKLLKSTDAGQSWYVIYSNTSSFDIEFLNSQNLVSVGIGGSIYKSMNGGENWVQKNSSTTQSLKSVDFINNTNGFAVGWNGTIVKTTDGGENWSNLNLGTSETLWKIKFINQNIGYIIGYNGFIYYTNDSGDNWHLQNSTTDESLNDIYFVDDTTGYIIGNSGTLLKTINGGIVGIEKITEPPNRFFLYHNFPNPFNPITKIRFEIPNSTYAKLSVYDLLGREVTVLVNEYLGSGIYETEFDASGISSGIYFYTLKADNYLETKKLVLIK